jgi:hypothetical protein
MIRKETIDYNNNRIEQANSEKELWNVTNDVLNPRRESEWNIINKEGISVTEDKEVSEMFNELFVNKVEDFNSGIDATKIEDPLSRLKERMKRNKTTLEFKTITRHQLIKHLKKLSKKKSSENDGHSQENPLLETANLVTPLNAIMQSINLEGKVSRGLERGSSNTNAKKGEPPVFQ